ncbi:MAG TPA: ABC transporter permease [Bacillota bacterium]|jgi:acetoin utilization transport system permease protein|nr:ABC transporter permease [Bacillota bacterium]HOB86302.1 ABC transporter permease [Bacillota bacterium]HOP69617.1 ABC transporter permease [Bacillota bacterium]HPT34694.1 ABC transporter permease [Bacillota bacterium]HQD06274.1 ABC transporter permease [Bacillota bacterium]
MRLKDAHRMVCSSLKKNKSRTYMTVFATAVGCAFLIVLASLGYGVQKGVVDQLLEESILNQIQIHGKWVEVDGEQKHLSLDAELVSALEGYPGAKAVTRRAYLDQSPEIYCGSLRGRTVVCAVHFPAEAAMGRELYAGRLPEKENEVLVGYHFNDSFQQEEEIQEEPPEIREFLGRELKLEIRQIFDGQEATETFTVKVVGIAAAPSRDWERDQRIYISEDLLDRMEAFTKTRRAHILGPETPEEERETVDLERSPRRYDQVNLYTRQVEEVKEVAARLEKEGYLVYSVLNEIDEVNFYFLIFKVGLFLVGTIAVIIASIGIYNTMTMAVTERFREIGIMKAVGAHPRVIKRLFLLESGYIGVAGALTGVALAYLVGGVINLGLPLLFDWVFGETVPAGFRFSLIPADLSAISFLICTVTAVASGLRPAAKATQVDVLQALRRDL